MVDDVVSNRQSLGVSAIDAERDIGLSEHLEIIRAIADRDDALRFHTAVRKVRLYPNPFGDARWLDMHRPTTVQVVGIDQRLGQGGRHHIGHSIKPTAVHTDHPKAEDLVLSNHLDRIGCDVIVAQRRKVVRTRSHRSSGTCGAIGHIHDGMQVERGEPIDDRSRVRSAKRMRMKLMAHTQVDSERSVEQHCGELESVQNHAIVRRPGASARRGKDGNPLALELFDRRKCVGVALQISSPERAVEVGDHKDIGHRRTLGWVNAAILRFNQAMTTGTTTATLPNPIDRAFWLRPAGAVDQDLALLRNEAPVSFHAEEEVAEDFPLPQGKGSWVVTKHADILTVSKNPKIFSSAAGITVLDSPPEFNEYFTSMIAMDDPRHARLRKLVSAGFTPRMLAQLQETIESVATGIIDDVCERGEIDFVVDVAAALPLKIVCDLMGIPESHYQFVFDQSNVILGAGDPEYVAPGNDILTAIFEAGTNLTQLMNDVAEAKQGGDGTDLTSMLVNAEIEDDRLTGQDLASFFILLVVAGNETTRNSTSWGMKYLTDNPDQQAIWMNDVDGVGPKAVEEIVRLASPVTYMRRTTTEDTVLGGTEIPAGDKVSMFYLAANRDEDVFEDPHAFNVTRDPNPHVGFGGPGPHFCLGAHLARRQIHVMFRQLFERLPDIAVTGEPDLLASSFIHGIKHLPASFTPTARS